jgi:LysR family transcriptional activator of mexEF-oprN operon
MTEQADIDLRGHDLNLFVVFAALMEERSVTRAAQRLHMSQAAVSAALGRLRRAYDDELFVRGPRGVTPTLRAKRMHGPIVEALHAMQIAVGGEQIFDPATDRFDLRIGMSDDLEALLMPQLLSTVSPTAPGLSIFCVQTNRLRIAAMLEAGEADLGVVANAAWGSSYRYRVLFESGYSCVYDPRLVGHEGPVGYDEFLALPHVMISFDGTRGIVDDTLESMGEQRHRLASTSHFAMAPFLLKRAASIATMPTHVARVFAREFGLAVCVPPIELPAFEVAVVWHQVRDSDPRIKWMVRTIEDLGKGIDVGRRTA